MYITQLLVALVRSDGFPTFLGGSTMGGLASLIDVQPIQFTWDRTIEDCSSFNPFGVWSEEGCKVAMMCMFACHSCKKIML